MIKGCMMAIFTMLPNSMLNLAYGEEGMEFRKNCGKTNTLVRFFMNVLMFWAFAGLLAIIIARDYERLSAIIFGIAPVVIYIAWAVFSRKSINKQISQLRYQLVREKQEEERFRKEGKWKCPYCERINETTDIICKDCGSYR